MLSSSPTHDAESELVEEEVEDVEALASLGTDSTAARGSAMCLGPSLGDSILDFLADCSDDNGRGANGVEGCGIIEDEEEGKDEGFSVDSGFSQKSRTLSHSIGPCDSGSEARRRP